MPLQKTIELTGSHVVKNQITPAKINRKLMHVSLRQSLEKMLNLPLAP